MAKRLNPHAVKQDRSYTIDEVAGIFGLHHQTVRGWGKLGLRILKDRRPFLITGRDLRKFLSTRRQTRRPLKDNEVFCPRCRAGTLPAGQIADYITTSATAGRLEAVCSACESIANRMIRIADIPLRCPNLDVTFRVPEDSLTEPTELLSKTHFAKETPDD